MTSKRIQSGTVVDPTRVDLPDDPITTYLMVSIGVSPNYGRWICLDGRLIAVSSLEAMKQNLSLAPLFGERSHADF